MQGKFSVRRLAIAAVTAAMYAALSYVAYGFNSAFGPVQFRISEALTLLPFLFPETAWGLFVGCILTNLLSQYGACGRRGAGASGPRPSRRWCATV